MGYYVAVLGLVTLFAIFGSRPVAARTSDGVRLVNGTPRGLRNNNPGNIRTAGTRNGIDGADPWVGLTGHDELGYGVFSDARFGIRAIGKILDSYAARGLRSVRQIVTTWAPPEGKFQAKPGGEVLTETNPTEDYIAHVAERLNVTSDHPLTPAHRPALVEAIILHENGRQPFSRGEIELGLQS